MEDIIFILEQARNTADKAGRVAKLRQAKILLDALMIVESGGSGGGPKNILHG